MHSVREPSIPAFGGSTKLTVTVELTLVHGGGTLIV
jgi:hypothetical protein